MCKPSVARFLPLSPWDDVDLSALTTEQLIEIASHMSDAEDIQFSTTITPFMELVVSQSKDEECNLQV
jgi:hypothetical protein